MIQNSLVLALSVLFPHQTIPVAGSANPEATVVDYLKANVKPGEELVVSKLVNEVFTGAAEQKVLNRLFNTFFKIPLFAVETVRVRGTPPTLKPNKKMPSDCKRWKHSTRSRYRLRWILMA